MNKEKNVYDELLGYKVKSEDVKTIADLFILLQDNNIDINLKDLLLFYNKRINIRRFNKLIKTAVKENINIPFDNLKGINLTGNDFLNLIAGIISAKQQQLAIRIEDIAYFAKMKINISDLLPSLKIINRHDPDITLNDFAHCHNCLYETKIFVNEITALKKYDPELSLKQVITLPFEKHEAGNILKLHKKLKAYSTLFSLSDIMNIKQQGIDVIDFLNGLLSAEKHNIKLSKEKIQQALPRCSSFEALIKAVYTPDRQEIKPVRVILKSGLEMLLKISFLFFADPENIASPMNKDAVTAELKKQLSKASKDTDNAKDFLSKSHAITENTQQAVNNLKPAYKVRALNIDDYIIGKHIPAEQEMQIYLHKKLRTQAKIAYEREHKKYKQLSSPNQTAETDEH